VSGEVPAAAPPGSDPGPPRLGGATFNPLRRSAEVRWTADAESRRVFASLVRLLRDFDVADDAMHEAYAAAIESWQRDGVPANPRAWLISTGKFKALNSLHRQGRLKELEPEVASRL